MFDWFWMCLWWLHHFPFLQKNTSYQYSIDFQINMAENKCKSTQTFENVHNFIRWTLQHIYNLLRYEIYSHLLSNETAQRNPQRCTKLHHKVHNVLQNKIYWETDFSLCFGFVKQDKMKFTSSIEYSSYYIAVFIAIFVCTFYFKFCCISPWRFICK